MTRLLALVLAFLTPSGPSPAAGPGALGTIAGRVEIARKGIASDAANAVVWIEGLKAAGAARSLRAEMKSQGKKFVPRVVTVEKSAEVDFPNVDAIYHNVFSVSPVNRFDLGLYRSGGSKQKRFDEPGLVRVYCNIHPQMVGFVMVVDSDFAAVTGGDGSFRFENVPAGTWTVKIWHEEGGETSAPVNVRARAETAVALKLDATAFRREPHKNKYGKEYPPQAGTDDERY
ncbi:MAG: carboxypeptidase regulatory-like domain-containing protein [Acidobacteriota bacterium]|nr:carboxypeptidase regulatory-like domain-containing protein [Acidobacteriota bacterium]